MMDQNKAALYFVRQKVKNSEFLNSVELFPLSVGLQFVDQHHVGKVKGYENLSRALHPSGSASDRGATRSAVEALRSVVAELR